MGVSLISAVPEELIYTTLSGLKVHIVIRDVALSYIICIVSIIIIY